MMRFASVVFVALLCVGCSSTGGIDVSQDFDRLFDFTTLGTYAFAERTVSKGDDPRVYNELVIQRVQTAVDLTLEQKGFRKVDQDPDFYVGWHGSIQEQMNAETVHDNYGYDWGYYSPSSAAPRTGSRTYVNTWEEGTLIIDIVDARTNQLVWRGTGKALVEEPQSAEKAQRRFNDGVAKIMQHFPPKG